jgi:FKBP-type peptidyl-prolyl cis-trans isomerase FkpA
MSDVTAVPIRPIAKGSLTRLTLGIGAAILVAGGLAWAGTPQSAPGLCSRSDFKGAAPVTTASGVIFQTLKAGRGPKPTDSDIALVDYKGSLRNKTVFDQNQRTPLPVAGMIPGFTEALKLMQAGGKYRFCIPANLAYADKSPTAAIPANSPLMFDVTLLDFRSQAEVQMMQQQMQQQGMVPPPTR